MVAESKTRGLIIDGVIGSEHVDSSGEVLDVKGADISSLEKDGVLNFEHKGDENGGSFNSIVGRCIRARKIFKESDCDGARERMYWEKTQVPFIYGVFRLFDESDHENARAAAAIIRDQHAAGEEQILRLSIEGSTIEKQGNVLKHTIARAVALTRKPCNRTAITDVLHDPKAKKEESSVDPLAELLGTAKSEDPSRQTISSVPFVYTPYDAPENQLAEALDRLRKAMGGVPGAQVQDQALERPALASEQQRNRAKAALRDYDPHGHGPFRTYIKAQLPDACDEFIEYFSDLVDDMSVKGKMNFLRKAQGALFDMPRQEKPAPRAAAPSVAPRQNGRAARAPRQAEFGKPAPYLDPESYRVASVSVDRTAPRVPLFDAQGKPVLDDKGKHKTRPPSFLESKAVYDKTIAEVRAAHAAGDPNAPAIPPVELPGYKLRRRPVDRGRPPPEAKEGEEDSIVRGANNNYFDMKTGTLYTTHKHLPPLRVYIPSDDDHNYGQIYRNPHLNEVMDRANDNWMALHELFVNGETPDEILALGQLFARPSANTGIAEHERAFAYMKDLENKHGWDPAKKPVDPANPGSEKASKAFLDKLGKEYEAMCNGQMLPDFDHGIWSGLPKAGHNSPWSDSHIAYCQEKGCDARVTHADRKRVEAFAQIHNKSTGHRVRVQRGYLPRIGLVGGKKDSKTLGKWDAISSYHQMHGAVKEAYALSGGDGRLASQYLTQMQMANPDLGKGAKVKINSYGIAMSGGGNLLIPDTHCVRGAFGLLASDPRTEILKKLLWEPENEHLVHAVGQYLYRHHPVFQYVREKFRRRYGKDLGENGIFAGFWHFWAAQAEHENHRGWVNRAQNADTDHAIFSHAAKVILDRLGVPYNRHLLKAEEAPKQQGEHDDVWADGGSMPARCAHAMDELEARFGPERAVLAYHAFMVPALLSAGMSRAERLTERLRKAVEEKPAEPAQPDPKRFRQFRGNIVDPGEVEFLGGPQAGERLPLVHIGKDWHVILSPTGGNVRLNPDGLGRNFRILRTPQYVKRGAVARAVEHGLPHLAHTADQMALVNGLDLGAPPKPTGHPGWTERHGGLSGWVRADDGHVGFVKSSQQMKGFLGDFGLGAAYTSAQREAAFHLIARNVFGLGEHVPVTAAFQHPLTGEHHSVQQKVLGGEHVSRRNDTHTAHLHHLFQQGTLDKLALMDMVLGNSDRHPGNYLLTPGRAPGIHLIDNGLAFSTNPTDPTPVPDYWTKAGQNAFGPDERGDETAWMRSPLHPEAKRWVDSLDTGKLNSEMERLGVPREGREEAGRRLQLLKKRSGTTRANAYFAPFLSGRFRRPPTEMVGDAVMPVESSKKAL